MNEGEDFLKYVDTLEDFLKLDAWKVLVSMSTVEELKQVYDRACSWQV